MNKNSNKNTCAGSREPNLRTIAKKASPSSSSSSSSSAPSSSSSSAKENISGAQARLIAELQALSPIDPEPTFNALRRMAPAVYEATRTEMLEDLLAEELPGSNHLVEHLRKHPADFSPAYLETYRRTRDCLDEIIAQRTKAQIEEDIKRHEESIVYESRLDVPYQSQAARKQVVANHKAALEESKRQLAEFDTSPVRLHAVARHLRHRVHSYVDDVKQCVACSSAASAAASAAEEEDF
jgi:hypothetical protein